MSAGKYYFFKIHKGAKGYSYFFNNLEMGTCREIMRKSLVSYDYHFEQTMLDAGEYMLLSWRENGDYSTHDKMAGPLSHGWE